jgi:hypothetical protein
LDDFIKEVYLSQAEGGTPLWMTDEMDFFYYLDLIAYKMTKEDRETRATIDQFF